MSHWDINCAICNNLVWLSLKIHVNGSGWDAIISDAFEEPKGKWLSELIQFELTKLYDLLTASKRSAQVYDLCQNLVLSMKYISGLYSLLRIGYFQKMIVYSQLRSLYTCIL